jgi:hypothetical protein
MLRNEKASRRFLLAKTSQEKEGVRCKGIVLNVFWQLVNETWVCGFPPSTEVNYSIVTLELNPTATAALQNTKGLLN